MRKRTQAREFTIQLLYQLDITNDPPQDALDNFWLAHKEEEITPEVKEFSEELVKGTVKHLADIDTAISSYAQNWQLKRMAVVDRNILRLGAYELMFCQDIPPKVSINEAVELAKKYSSLQAAKFVNGILDKIKMEKGK